jgi:hypothetical protein
VGYFDPCDGKIVFPLPRLAVKCRAENIADANVDISNLYIHIHKMRIMIFGNRIRVVYAVII